MYKTTKPFVIKVVTPLHAGSGQDLGIVDLPIQRERHTSYPKIEASGLKGSIRDHFRNSQKTEKKDIDIIFGPEKSGDHAGALGFTDAKILLFPVKSAKGLFAWITCNDVLNKFKTDLKLCEIKTDFTIPKNPNGECIVTENSNLKINDNAVVLEEYAFKISQTKIDENLIKILESFTAIDNLNEQLLILSNDDFKDFVNLSTEVITRTKIDVKTGTVAKGALFSEEYLPAESIMYSLAIASSIFTTNDKKKDFLNGKSDKEAVISYWVDNVPKIMQIGGNANIGKGIVEIVIPKMEDTNANN